MQSKSLMRGFSLIELMIVLVIIGILAAIAYPSYISYITHSRRAAAAACLSNYAQYMERYYTTNLSYSGMDNTALNNLKMDCASAQNTGQNYQYSFPSAPTSSAYSLEATPIGTQSSRDTKCGTLGLDQTGAETITGTGSVDQCW